ncbi:unnamed protein product [Bursaphelenchus okinawaensis]|uniref:Trehalase n=1 Tax=Bursaphelenchus okinawaensis TaxID=465554 RepID=A0A811K9Q8_9BILA|nr:unnamed protein product [Bursaphelenchus okinawaensis]CAG9094163.1 unnamed protein product [Bursaphelenchus okinawaensis]
MAVTKYSLFSDSKTFTELPLRLSPEDVLNKFNILFPTDEQISKDTLKQFVEENFYSADSLESGRSVELNVCTPVDWKPIPPSFLQIQDKSSREFALDIHKKWTDLCRSVTKNVEDNPNRFSLIYLKHPFIVPGGRFREMYYWDSYWTIKGLLVSEMYESVRFMLLNMADLIKKFGLIPNGGRIYYLQRSQPPLFGFMIKEYFDKTKDVELVKELLPFLEKEFEFWDKNRSRILKIDDDSYRVYQCNADSDFPRPESHKEDVNLTKNVTEVDQKHKIWHELASAAESGWDFSTRWLRNNDDLSTLETTSILPVDLNAFICGSKMVLMNLYKEVGGNGDRIIELEKEIRAMKKMMDKVFLDFETGTYLDYNIRKGCHNREFYPIAFAPFFCELFDDEAHDEILNNTFRRMKEMGAWDYVGGIPASLTTSQEQWDFPNVWPPLVHMVVEALRKSSDSTLKKAGYDLATKFVAYSYEVFKEYGYMFEKYEATGRRKVGSGGEYKVQQGFGWTNGVVLDIIMTYKDEIELAPRFIEEPEENTEPWYLHPLHAIHFAEHKPIFSSTSPAFSMFFSLLRML